MSRVQNSPAPSTSVQEQDVEPPEEPQAAAPQDPGAPASEQGDRIEHAPSEPSENAWVHAVQQQEQKVSDAGTRTLELADQEAHQGDLEKALHDQQAAAAFARGDYGAAAWAKLKGAALYAEHLHNQVVLTAGAAAESVVAGVMDAARGDPDAVKKVAVGGAVIAAVCTAGTSVAAGGVVGAAIEGLGAANTAYEATQHLGGMARAEDAEALADNAKRLALDLAAGAVGGKLAKGAIKSAGLAEKAGLATVATGERVGTAVVSATGRASERVAATGLRAGLEVAHVAGGAAHEVMEAAEAGAAVLMEKTAHERAAEAIAPERE
jgi:hypothetical protein